MPAKQSRRWTWTLNNPTPSEIAHTKTLGSEQHVSYLVWGLEIAPSTGTPHLQGYAEFTKRLTLGGLKRLVASRIHAERAQSGPTQNRAYCLKIRPGDTPNEETYEWGEMRLQNLHGNDAHDRLNEMLREGSSLAEIAEENPSLYCRLHKGIDRFIQVTRCTPRTTKSTVICLYGSTGTGKSRWAHEELGVTYTHANDRWFDGYLDHDAVLFDDFDGVSSGITYRKWLQMCDRYPMQVPYKGGFQQWSPKIIVFTSNLPPSQWYQNEAYAPLERRLDYIWEFQPATITVHKGPQPNNLELLGDNVYYNPYFE